MEIVDEDGSNIVSQFLLDANTLDPVKILRRMNGIVAGMYHDSLNLLDNKEKSIALSIASRDDEVDRQYFLLVRLIRTAIIEKKLATKLNLSNIDILDYRIAEITSKQQETILVILFRLCMIFLLVTILIL